MKTAYLLGLATSLVLVSCSSAPEKEVQAPTVDTEAIESVEEDVAGAPVMMPFQIGISAEDSVEGSVLTIRLDYLDELRETTTLRVDLGEGTKLVEGAVLWREDGSKGSLKRTANALIENIDPVPAGSKLVRKLVVVGDSPSIDVKLGLYAEGLAMEMHEVWPPKMQPMKQFDAIKPLEHPIEINGITVEQSVEVRPKHRISD